MIKRTIYNQIKSHLDQKEISLIIGPRQAGKTTLMLELQKELREQNKNTLFLNLDIEADKQFFQSQELLIKKIELEIGKAGGFVFIDEIQRKENAGLFLKGIYDMNLPYKLIISGSGSVELKEKIHESLAGRKRVFEIGTISFREFVNFKTDYKYQKKLEDFFTLEKSKTDEYAKEYMAFGGYPRVVLAETIEEKTKIIEEIYSSFVEKDLVNLLGIQKTDDLGRLLKITASQIGKLVNYSELSSTLGISQTTVNNYLWYTEKTFIINKITPYFQNVRKEIVKSPAYYFTDLGMRNFILGIFGNYSQISFDGFIFQNFIYLLLKDNQSLEYSDIHLWRTKDGAEVDFILEKGQNIIPIEVKLSDLKKPEITRSLRSFLNQYPPEEAFVVNLSYNSSIVVNKTKILFLPYYQVLFLK